MDKFTALAEPTRRNILELLAGKGKMPASEIYDKFDVSAPAISQHLKVLREAKLVEVEKNAQQRIYAINPLAVNEISEWLKTLQIQWEKRFDRIDALLKKEQKQSK